MGRNRSQPTSTQTLIKDIDVRTEKITRTGEGTPRITCLSRGEGEAQGVGVKIPFANREPKADESLHHYLHHRE